MGDEEIGTLVDKYGISFSKAKWIVEHEDGKAIYSLITQAYRKGRNYDTEMWRGSSGGY